MANIKSHREVTNGNEEDSATAPASVCGTARYFALDRQTAQHYSQSDSQKRYRMGDKRTRKTSKVDKWNKVRAELKKDFERWGVTCCEMCGGNFALSFAHSLKRRFIKNDEQLKEVALLCQACHDRVEHSGHQSMYETIKTIIHHRQLKIEVCDKLHQALIEHYAVAKCEICGYQPSSLDSMTEDKRLCLVCKEATHERQEDTQL